MGVEYLWYVSNVRKRNARRKSCLSVTLSTTNLTGTDPVTKSGLPRRDAGDWQAEA